MSIFERCPPATEDFGLIDAPIHLIAEQYLSWWAGLGYTLKMQRVRGAPDDLFAGLEPYANDLTRTLLLPTTCGWTAFFRNGLQGSDPSSAMPVLATRLGVRAMRVCATADTATFPATMWAVYDPTVATPNSDPCVRAIAAANDGGRWVFHDFGDPYAFEQTARYTARRKRDRFDRALLIDYLGHFGIAVEGDDLLGGDTPLDGVLLTRPLSDRVKPFSRNDILAGRPWQR